MWDIPADTTDLPSALANGHESPDVDGALSWSSFNDYGYFGPCPNFDPALPRTAFDQYAFVVYALPDAVSEVPAPEEGISTVRQLDGYFASIALAATEIRLTSDAQSSEFPPTDQPFPPVAIPPCPSEGEQPEECIAAD